MAHEFRMTHRVEFAMTDLAGIMHFSNFFRMMEVTEHAFFRSLGFSIDATIEGVKYGFPRVHASCDYRAPLRFEEEVEVQLLVREVKRSSLVYEFLFWKLGEGARTLAAQGKFTVVCVSWDANTKRMKAVSLPPALASQFEVAPSEG